MKIFKSLFSRPPRKSTPVFADNLPLDISCRQWRTEPTRYVRKIEICRAVARGNDFWVAPTDTSHLHTSIRIFLEPCLRGPEAREEVILVERVLASVGAYHSVTPIKEVLPFGGTLFQPDVHDRVCVVISGPSTAFAEHLEVERTLVFDGSSGVRLTLADLGQILEYVSRATKLICAGGDCKYQSRTFAFTCMGALTPRLPPCSLVRKPGESVGINGPDVVNDSMFELVAMTFLDQVRLSNDPASSQALRLIESLKSQFARATASFC